MKKLLLLVGLFLLLACSLHAATKNLVPNVPGDGGLGTATKQWREVNASTGAFSAKLTLGGVPVATTNQAGVIALDVAQQVTRTNSAAFARLPISGLTNHSPEGENIVALRSRDFGFEFFDLVNTQPLAEFLYDGFTFHKTIVSEGDFHFAKTPYISGTNVGEFIGAIAGNAASGHIRQTNGVHFGEGPGLRLFNQGNDDPILELAPITSYGEPGIGLRFDYVSTAGTGFVTTNLGTGNSWSWSDGPLLVATLAAVTNASTNLAYEVARIFTATNTQGPEDFTVGNQINATAFSGGSADLDAVDATSVIVGSGGLRIDATGTNTAGGGVLNFGRDGTNFSFYTDGLSILTRNSLGSFANLSGSVGYFTGGLRSLSYGDYSAGFVATAPKLQRHPAPLGASWQVIGGDGVGSPSNHFILSGTMFPSNGVTIVNPATNQTGLFMGTNSPGTGTPMFVVTNAVNGTAVGIGRQPAAGSLGLEVQGPITCVGGSVSSGGSIYAANGNNLTWLVAGAPVIKQVGRGVSVLPYTGNGTNQFQVTDTNNVPAFEITSNNVVEIDTAGTNVAGFGAINFGKEGTNGGFYFDGNGVATPNNFTARYISTPISVSAAQYVLTGSGLLNQSASATAQGPMLRRMAAPDGSSWEIVGGDGVGTPTNRLIVSGQVVARSGLVVTNSQTNFTSLFLGTNAPGVGTPSVVVSNAINGTMVGIGKQPNSGINYSLDVAQGINAGGSLVTLGNVYAGNAGLLTWNAVNTPAFAKINRGISAIPGIGNATNHFQVTETNGHPVFGVNSNGLVFGNFTFQHPEWWASGSSNVVWRLVKNVTLTNVADVSSCAYYPSNNSIFVVHNNANGRITEWSLDGVCLRIIDWTAGQLPDAESITYLGGTRFAEVDEDYNRIVVFSITNQMASAPTHVTFDTINCTIVCPTSLGTDLTTGSGLEGIALDPDRNGWWLAKEKSPAQLLFLDSTGATNNYFTAAQMQAFTNSTYTDFSDLYLDRKNQLLWLTQDEPGQNDSVLAISLVTSNVVTRIPMSNFGQMEGLSVMDDGTLLVAGEVNQLAIYTPEWGGANGGLNWIRPATNSLSVPVFPLGLYLPTNNAPLAVTNGLAALWNSNGAVYLRYSVAGYTTNCDKPLFP